MGLRDDVLRIIHRCTKGLQLPWVRLMSASEPLRLLPGPIHLESVRTLAVCGVVPTFSLVGGRSRPRSLSTLVGRGTH